MHGQNTPVVAAHGVESEPQRKLLSVDQVAHTLGGITRREVYRRLDDGDMESVWIGRRRLVTAESVDVYINRLREQAKAKARAAA